jgi:catechol 2,3-dioxygenase-like lactoylglutathione lyase family enzyme
VFDALAHEARRHIVQVLAHYRPELPSGYLAKRFSTVGRRRHGTFMSWKAAGSSAFAVAGATASIDRSAITSSASSADDLGSSRHGPPSKSRALRAGVPSRKDPRHDHPKLFRVTVEVGDLDRATELYRDLFGGDGERHRGARHYFDCGGTIIALIDVSQGGLSPTPGPKSLYFAVEDIEAVHERASRLGVLAPYQVHGEPAGDVIERPWGERSFYIVDPWRNALCFCQDGTRFT